MRKGRAVAVAQASSGDESDSDGRVQQHGFKAPPPVLTAPSDDEDDEDSDPIVVAEALSPRPPATPPAAKGPSLPFMSSDEEEEGLGVVDL